MTIGKMLRKWKSNAAHQMAGVDGVVIAESMQSGCTKGIDMKNRRDGDVL